MRLADLTWPELDGGPALTLLLPLGATEQHGPHLPLDTDTVIVEALAEAAARLCNDVVVAPTLPFGSSGEHASFPGTLSLGHEALELSLLELIRSADHFASVVVACWHGGNGDTLERAARRLVEEGRRVSVWQPRHSGTDLHAGETETSLMLLLNRERVRAERPRGALDPLEVIEPTLRREGVAAVSPNGVLGDAHSASAEKGQAIFDALVGDLRRFLADNA